MHKPDWSWGSTLIKKSTSMMLHSSSSSSSSAAAASLGKARRVQWIHIKYVYINYIKVSILDIQLAAAFKLFESYTKTPGSRSNLWSFFGRPVHEQVKFANKVLLLLMKALKFKHSIYKIHYFSTLQTIIHRYAASTSSLPAAAFFCQRCTVLPLPWLPGRAELKFLG